MSNPNSPLQILHIYKDYYPVLGGIENHVKLLAEQQAAAGHQVIVLVTNRAPVTSIEEANGVQVIKAARLATLASTPLSLSFLRQLSKQRPDIAHLHFPYPLGEIAQYILGHSRHTVLTYHSDVVRQRTLLRLYTPLMRHVLRSVDRIIVTTPNYLESSPILQPYLAKCEVVPLGIEQTRFLQADTGQAQAIRERYGGGPLLLFVGALRYYKGLQYLLPAMQQVSAKLLIVGEGPMDKSLREQAQTLGLSDKIIFVGRVSDEELPAYYRAAELFVLPASERSEAFGLVQVEAMSSGVPVICTELGTGTSYVNRHEESGLVVPPKDSEALAQAIHRLLADATLRQRLAEGALARSTHFSAEEMVAGIQEVYEEIIG